MCVIYKITCKTTNKIYIGKSETSAEYRWKQHCRAAFLESHGDYNFPFHRAIRKYGIDDFFAMPTSPEVDYFFQRNGKQIPIYKTYKIIGTVISKNDTKATVTLLTTTGVVSVKFTKEYYAMFARQLSEKQADGTKKVVEKGWFKRGTLLMITGFRRDDQFVAKTYSKTSTHQIYKLELENDGKDLVMTHERYQSNLEE